ncbi:MAG: hypothetical protein SPE59_01495 [Treponema sp.]|nr:hypothetical protein [Treponema sp.]
MEEIKKKFARNLGEATEYSGKKMSNNEVADVLNSAGFKTSRGTDYKGGRGTAHFLKEAAVQLHEDGDDEGCEMVRQITSHNGYYSDVQEEENEDDDWDDEDDDCDDEDDDCDDPSTYAHCGDWEDEPENCAFCADDDCPLNRS